MNPFIFMHDDHHHEESWFDEFLGLQTDLAHWLFEIEVTLVIDFIVIFLGYQLLLKKVLIPRLRNQLHKEIDEEHHIEHTEDGGHIHHDHD